MLENRRAMIAHSGPQFDRWRKRTLAAFGIIELDESRDAA